MKFMNVHRIESAMQFNTMQSNAVQYSTAHYGKLQYNAEMDSFVAWAGWLSDCHVHLAATEHIWSSSQWWCIINTDVDCNDDYYPDNIDFLVVYVLDSYNFWRILISLKSNTMKGKHQDLLVSEWCNVSSLI